MPIDPRVDPNKGGNSSPWQIGLSARVRYWPYRGVWKCLYLLPYWTWWCIIRNATCFSDSLSQALSQSRREKTTPSEVEKKCERVKGEGREGVLNKRKRICAWELKHLSPGIRQKFHNCWCARLAQWESNAFYPNITTVLKRTDNQFKIFLLSYPA